MIMQYIYCIVKGERDPSVRFRPFETAFGLLPSTPLGVIGFEQPRAFRQRSRHGGCPTFIRKRF